MQELDKEFKSAGQWAWFAERDARMRSLVNASHFNKAQKLKAEQVKLALDAVYSSKEIYIEYRKKFISVKVHGAMVRDRKTLVMIESWYAEEGIEKIKTKQGVTYRIIKA